MASIPLSDIQLMEDPMSPDIQVEQYIQQLEAVCQHSDYWIEIAKKFTPEARLNLRRRIALVIEKLKNAIQRLEQIDADRT